MCLAVATPSGVLFCLVGPMVNLNIFVTLAITSNMPKMLDNDEVKKEFRNKLVSLFVLKLRTDIS